MLNKNQITRKLVFIFLTALCFLVWPDTLKSQSRINSPYSMFGPGEIKGNEYFRNMGMGGISQGFRSNQSVNYMNPASYTSVDSLSFIFDGTVFAHLYQQRYSGEKQTSLFSNLGGLNFAFPATRWWGVAAGILPWSLSGYQISDFQTDNDYGRVNFLYEGSGGINQVYLGNAIKPFRGLSVGLNVAFLFGRLEDISTAYSDSAGFFRTVWSDTREVRGLMLTSGIQYQISMGASRNLTLGASYAGPATLDITRNNFVYRILPLGAAAIIDTLNTSVDRNGKMEIPAAMAAGVFMQFNPRWSAGLDYQSQNWSEYRTFNENHNLNDAYQVRFGTSFRPRQETFSGYLSRLEYRGGLRYGQSHLSLTDNTGIRQAFSEFGISFGIGLPVPRSLSTVNLGFEYAQRSSGNSSLINENFFRFNIGVNVYERWFVRRKFN
jgi:hypothetical protein